MMLAMMLSASAEPPEKALSEVFKQQLAEAPIAVVVAPRRGRVPLQIEENRLLFVHATVTADLKNAASIVGKDILVLADFLSTTTTHTTLYWGSEIREHPEKGLYLFPFLAPSPPECATWPIKPAAVTKYGDCISVPWFEGPVLAFGQDGCPVATPVTLETVSFPEGESTSSPELDRVVADHRAAGFKGFSFERRTCRDGAPKWQEILDLARRSK